MNKSPKDIKRDVIPRWRDYKTTLELHEFNSISSQKTNNIDLSNNKVIMQKQNEWKANLTLPFATDLINTAMTENKYDYAIEAAEFILSDENSPELSKKMARNIIIATNESNSDIRYTEVINPDLNMNYSIIALKRQLSIYHQNAIGWCELSREYMIRGQIPKAANAMKVALSYAPNNRYILRSAVAMYVNLGELDKANYYIQKSNNFKKDPWLLSSEIALMSIQDKISKNIKIANSIIDSQNFSNYDLTELASTISMFEYNDGTRKKARKMLNLSLQCPNDNSFAQAIWASDSYSISLNENCANSITVPLAYEAYAYKHKIDGDFENSLIESKKWIFDQMFSKDSITFATYIASTALRQYEVAIQIAKQGLSINPKDPVILNNLSYSLAKSGNFTEADKVFNKINFENLDENQKSVWYASKGLIQYKYGNVEMGRDLYNKAINYFKTKRDEYSLALASIYYAEEEILAKGELANVAYTSANEYASKINDSIVKSELTLLKTSYDSM